LKKVVIVGTVGQPGKAKEDLRPERSSTGPQWEIAGTLLPESLNRFKRGFSKNRGGRELQISSQ